MAAITTMVMAVAMAMADGNERDWGCSNSQKQCLTTMATITASALTCRPAGLLACRLWGKRQAGFGR